MATQHIHPDYLIFIQSRAEIHLPLVEEYAQMMADGVEFDPVEGVQDEDGKVFVWDGFHRGEAAKTAGINLLVNLRPGTRLEAEWLAFTANQKHGLRRTTRDKQHVVRRALRHPYGVQLSNREIARHCGVDDKTVGRIRRELEATAEIPQLTKRMVTKASGESYELETTNIGNRPSPSYNEPRHNRDESGELAETDQPHWDSDLSDRSDSEEQPKYQLEPQPYACPRCGQPKIVGVNGSRRWCLNCLAEWPTAAEFLAEVEGGPEPTGPREQLQHRFATLLARLEPSDPHLAQIGQWLDELEQQLAAADSPGPGERATAWTSLLPLPEYA